MRLAVALILSAALLSGCLAQREPLPGTNGIAVAYASQSQMPGCNGQWRPQEMTILLSYGAPEWVVAHEVSHAADTLGSYQIALRLIGNPRGLERQMSIAREIATHADALGGTPLAYWKALHIRYGDSAVQHPEILAAVRIPSLAMKAKK